MSGIGGYIVVHEYPMMRGDVQFSYGIVSGAHVDDLPERVITALEGAENQLAYCKGMQERQSPGSEGRYFIARFEEVTDR